MAKTEDKGWSPYLAGALSGVVSILSIWIAGKFFGASTTFVRSAGIIERLFDAERVGQMAYFVKEVPKIEWQWMFVVGVFIGSLVASTTSHTFQWKPIPDMWEGALARAKSNEALLRLWAGS